MRRRKRVRSATKASVTSTIQQIDNLLELRDGEVGDFGVVLSVVWRRRNRGRRRRLRRKNPNEMLHALQSSGSSFLNGYLLTIHPQIGMRSQIYGHPTVTEEKDLGLGFAC